MSQWSNTENVGIQYVIDLDTLFRNGRVSDDYDDDGDDDGNLTLGNLNCHIHLALFCILPCRVRQWHRH